MAEPPSSPRRPAASRPESFADGAGGPSSTRAALRSANGLEGVSSRVASLQMLVALGVGTALVALPLYLVRRPAKVAAPASSAVTADASAEGAGARAEDLADAGAAPVTLEPAKVHLCQDVGPGKTAPEACDHLPKLEADLARAITESATCIPLGTEAGSLTYVLDVSFRRSTWTVVVPKAMRTIKAPRAALACQAAVRGKLAKLTLDDVAHEHSRYRIGIVATYPAR